MDRIRIVINEKFPLRDNARIWLVFLILLPLVLITIRNPNNDFGIISSIVRDWVAGRMDLYEAGSVYYNYTPWLAFFYLPLSFIPNPFGQLIFNIISLSLLIWSTWYLSKPISWRAMAISLTTIYTAMLIIQGQWDAIVLASLTLGWIGFQRKNPWLVGIALVGMTTKYTNVIIPMLILLFAIRSWPIKKLILTAVIPLGIFGISFVIAGWDWPIRYFHLLKVTMAYFQKYEVTTLFSNTSYPVSYRLILPPLGSILTILLALLSLYLLFRLLRRGVSLDSMNLALALNLVVSPYFTFHHIIYLAPLQARLLKKHQIWGFVLVGTAIIDALLLWLGVGLIIYPIVALVIVLITTFRSLNQPEVYATE
jgi:hypothetical protein